MHFTEEIAILQSALQLADKKCRMNLTGFHLPEDEGVLPIVHHAMREVLDGPAHQKDDLEQQHWKFKVTLILIYKVLQKEGMTGVESNSLCAVCQDMPTLNGTLLCNVVERFTMTRQLLEILQSLPPTVSRHLWSCILSGMDTGASQDDARLFVNLLQYLSLVDNSILYGKNTGSNTKPDSCDAAREVSHILKLSLVKLGSVDLEMLMVQERIEILVASFNLLTILLSEGETVTIIREPRAGPKSHGKSDAHDTHTSVIQGACLEVFVQKPLIDADVCVQVCVDIIEKISASEGLNEGFSRLSNTASICEGSILWRWYPVHFANLLQSLFCKYFEKLSRLNDAAGDPRIQNGIHVALARILSKLSPLYLNLVDRDKQRRSSEEKDENQLSRLAYIVQERLQGFQECFSQLLCMTDLDVLTQESWILNIEENSDLLSNAENLKSAVSRLHLIQTQHQQSHDVIARLQKVILKSYSQLSGALQSCLMVGMHTLYDMERLFPADEEAVDTRLTVLCNQLVNDTQSPEMVGEIVSLGLQCPPMIVNKLITTAIQNKAQTAVLVKVLQLVPSLPDMAAINGDCSLLCMALVSAATRQKLSPKEEQNFIQLCRLLLQEYKRDTVQMLPVLKHQELLQAVILHNSPFGVHKPVPLPSHLSPLANLKLLVVALETMEQLSGNWTERIESSCPVAIGYLLCCILESCLSVGQTEMGMDSATNSDVINMVEGVSNGDMKGHVIEALALIGRILIKHSCPVEGITWLKNNVLKLSWPTSLYAWCHLVGEQKAWPLVIPTDLCEILDLPKEINTFPVNVDNLSNGMLNLLEFAQVSDWTLQITTKGLKKDIDLFETMSYESVVWALSVLLPYCLVDECRRLGHFVNHLFKDGLLKVFPAGNNLGTTELQCCTCLCDAVLALAETTSAKTEKQSQQVFSMVTKGFGSTIKDVCIDPVKLNPASLQQHPGMFAAMFELVCQCLSVLPDHCSEQIMVVALDILTVIPHQREHFECDTQEVTLEPLEVETLEGQEDKEKVKQRDRLLNSAAQIHDDSIRETLSKKIEEIYSR